MLCEKDRTYIATLAGHLRDSATAEDLKPGDMAAGGWFEIHAKLSLQTAFDMGIRRGLAQGFRVSLIAWGGTALQIAGAAMVASNWVSPYWGYATMLPGALVWLGVAIARRDQPQGWLQLAFVVLNTIGLARWMA